MLKKSEFTKEYYKTGEVAKMLKVTPTSIMRYEAEGLIKFDRTEQNRRVISRDNLLEYLRGKEMLIEDSARRDVIYARVSTHKQSERGDLERQVEQVLAFAAMQNPVNIEIIKEVSSGLNDNRSGLKKLLRAILSEEIHRVFINYKDRLTRFGFRYLETICVHSGTEIVIVSSETQNKSIQEELAEDLCAIIHSFSGKLYGMRKTAKPKIEVAAESLFEEGSCGKLLHVDTRYQDEKPRNITKENEKCQE